MEKVHLLLEQMTSNLWLKTTQIIMSQFQRWEVQAGMTASLALGPTRSKSRCCQGCSYFWGFWRWTHLRTLSVCWPNSVPCGCRTEVPIILLAVRQRLLLAPYTVCILHHIAPSAFKPEKVHWVLLTFQISPTSPLAEYFFLQPEYILCLKELIWLDWAHQV